MTIFSSRLQPRSCSTSTVSKGEEIQDTVQCTVQYSTVYSTQYTNLLSTAELVQAGSQVVLTCAYTVSPGQYIDSIKWYLNNAEVIPSPIYITMHKSFKRRFTKISQSRRRPLLGPSPG